MRFLPAGQSRQVTLLAPEHIVTRDRTGSLSEDSNRYNRLLANMQRLRGRIYLSDGAIQPWQLTSDGRHVQPIDRSAWHVLLVDANERVFGCARYLEHDFPLNFEALSAGRSEIAYSQEWGCQLHRAVMSQAAEAYQRGVAFAEVGGWALAEEIRHGMEALRIALTMYSLAESLGGCIGLTTATVRHSSAAILRKIGGSLLRVDGTEIPRYYDSRYKCDMEILRFDSSTPSDRFRESIDRITAELAQVPVVTGAVWSTKPSPSRLPVPMALAARVA